MPAGPRGGPRPRRVVASRGSPATFGICIRCIANACMVYSFHWHINIRDAFSRRTHQGCRGPASPACLESWRYAWCHGSSYKSVRMCSLLNGHDQCWTDVDIYVDVVCVSRAFKANVCWFDWELCVCLVFCIFVDGIWFLLNNNIFCTKWNILCNF